MEHKKRGCVISPDNGSKVGLKAQKLLAQGIALGIMAISKTPCKGKSFKNSIIKLLPLQGDFFKTNNPQGVALG